MDSSLASTFALTSVSTLFVSALEQPQSSWGTGATTSGTWGATDSGALGASGSTWTHFPSL